MEFKTPLKYPSLFPYSAHPKLKLFKILCTVNQLSFVTTFFRNFFVMKWFAATYFRDQDSLKCT